MRLLTILFTFLWLNAYAQVEYTPTLVGRYFGGQTGAGAGFWTVSGEFTDESGYFDASGIQVGDMLFFSDGGKGYFLPVVAVNSATGNSFVVGVNNTGITGVVGVPTGAGAIYRKSGEIGLFPFASGIANPDQQTYNNYMVSLIEGLSISTATLSVGSATAFVKYIGTVPVFTNESSGVYRILRSATTWISSINFFFNNTHTDGSGDLSIEILSPASTYDWWKPDFIPLDTEVIVDKYSDRSIQVNQIPVIGAGTETKIIGFNGAFGTPGAYILARF